VERDTLSNQRSLNKVHNLVEDLKIREIPGLCYYVCRKLVIP